MILKHALLMLVVIKVVLSYKQYKFHELCTGSKFKTIFDKMTNNKPEVKLSRGDSSAALINHQWNSTTYKKFQTCEFVVRLENSYDDGGMFVSIRTLKLRENSYDSNSCEDFIRFTYKNGTSTREICGNINTSVNNNLIRNFFDVTSGEMFVEISIGSSYHFPADANLEVDLVFTAYSKSNFQNAIQCSHDKWISDVLHDDKIINCPPPGCPDEPTCVNYEKPTVYSYKHKDNSSSALFVVPLVIAVLVALLSIICFCNKKKPATSTPNDDEHVQELRPTARTDLDSYLEFQDVRSTPMAPQNNDRVLPYASQVPPYPTQQTTPHSSRPMPSAPPQLGFKDDPPPYDALFDSSKRAKV